jgi:hypothetical protein
MSKEITSPTPSIPPTPPNGTIPPMHPHTGIVYKFFELLGGFIEVRVTSSQEPSNQMDRGNDHDIDLQRRQVMQHCIVRHQSMLAHIVRSTGLDRSIAETHLYRLAVEVNPAMRVEALRQVA